MRLITRITLILILLAMLVTISAAYIITIDAPDTVIAGTPLTITGSTTFPEDTYFDLVLYYSKHTAGEIQKQKVIVDPSKQFRTDFETRELQKGQYKVEVHAIVSDGKEFVESSLGSASVTRRVIQVVDRSDEITIESPGEQNLSAALMVTGRVKKLGSGVVTLRAFGPGSFTYGPLQIITTSGFADDDGHFSTLVPVHEPGAYQVSFSDKKGYIGEYAFTVTAPEPEEAAPVVLTSAPTRTEIPSPPVTPAPTASPSPAPTRSSLSSALVAGGVIGGMMLALRRR